VTPTTPLATGNGQWWIQTYNTSGYGPWSGGLSFTVSTSGLPGAATLVSPSGSISTTTPTYVWNAVSDSSWYYLWVQDSSGDKIKTWYSAADAQCASGTGNCSVTPATSIATGDGQWWIQTYNSSGYGPWSSGLSFKVSAGGLPGAATLLSPLGTISTLTPVFMWNAVSNSTYYYLWVTDSTGEKIKEWYSAAQARCASGTGTCFVASPAVLAVGDGQWWIQTWNDAGYGPWSSGLSFNVSPSGVSPFYPLAFKKEGQ